MPGSMLRVPWHHLMLTPGAKVEVHHYHHFTDEEIEAQREKCILYKVTP